MKLRNGTIITEQNVDTIAREMVMNANASMGIEDKGTDDIETLNKEIEVLKEQLLR